MGNVARRDQEGWREAFFGGTFGKINSNTNWIGFFRPGQRKTSRSKGENQQQTQPTYGVDAGIWTRATLVGGERSHHCAIPCSLALSETQVNQGWCLAFDRTVANKFLSFLGYYSLHSLSSLGKILGDIDYSHVHIFYSCGGVFTLLPRDKLGKTGTAGCGLGGRRLPFERFERLRTPASS